jgi:hypothetical protein
MRYEGTMIPKFMAPRAAKWRSTVCYILYLANVVAFKSDRGCLGSPQAKDNRGIGVDELFHIELYKC